MAIAFVNSSKGQDDFGGTAVSTAALNVTGGNLIVVLTSNHAVGQTVTIADTAGNTYVHATSAMSDGGGGQFDIWYVANCTGNANNVVTATWSNGGARRVAQLQYSGAATTSPLVASGNRNHNGGVSAFTTSSFTPGVVGAVAVVGCSSERTAAQTLTAGTNYTMRETIAGTTSLNCFGAEDRLSAPSSAQTGSITGTNNDFWYGSWAVFKAQAADLTLAGTANQTWTFAGNPLLYKDLNGNTGKAYTLAGSPAVVKAISGSVSGALFTLTGLPTTGDVWQLGGTAAVRFDIPFGTLRFGATTPSHLWGLPCDIWRGVHDLVYRGIFDVSVPLSLPTILIQGESGVPGVYATRFACIGQLTRIQNLFEQAEAPAFKLFLIGAPTISAVVQISGSPQFKLLPSGPLGIGQNIGAYDLPRNSTPIVPAVISVPPYNAGNPITTSYIEPTYGTRIIRVSGTPGDAIPGTTGFWRTDKPYAGPGYTNEFAWNANQTKLVLTRGVRLDDAAIGITALLICDGSTYVPQSTIPIIRVEYRWHPTDPNLMLWVRADGSVGQVNVNTQQYTTIYLASGVYSATMGDFNGCPSNDGRWLPVKAYRSSDNQPVFYVVDLQTGTKYPSVTATSQGWTDIGGVFMSQSGTYVVASGATWGNSIRVFDVNGTWNGVQWTQIGHYDLGKNLAGQDVIYSSGMRQTFRLSDGVVTTIDSWPTAVEYHSSTRNINEPGWGYGGIESDSLANELLAHELAATGRIRRICPLRATGGSSHGAYDRTPFFVPSPDGLRVLFSSDWTNSAGPAFAFVVDVREVPLL